MKYVLILLVAMGCISALDAQLAKDKEANAVPRAKVVVGAAEVVFVAGTTLNNVWTENLMIHLTAKTSLFAGWSIDTSKPGSKQRQQQLEKTTEILAGEEGPWAIEGELMWERDSSIVRLGRSWPDKLLGRGEKQMVDLVVQSATKITGKNQGDFPAPGKVRVQGKAVCGQRDLKLVEEPTLALENGKLPIVLDGPKSKTDARAKGIIQATGTLTMDKRGFLRLHADTVKEIKQ